MKDNLRPHSTIYSNALAKKASVRRAKVGRRRDRKKIDFVKRKSEMIDINEFARSVAQSEMSKNAKGGSEDLVINHVASSTMCRFSCEAKVDHVEDCNLSPNSVVDTSTFQTRTNKNCFHNIVTYQDSCPSNSSLCTRSSKLREDKISEKEKKLAEFDEDNINPLRFNDNALITDLPKRHNNTKKNMMNHQKSRELSSGVDGVTIHRLSERIAKLQKKGGFL